MDLLAEHGEDVLAPIKVSAVFFLKLLKKQLGLTLIPSLSVPDPSNKLQRIVDKINGPPPTTVRAANEAQQDLRPAEAPGGRPLTRASLTWTRTC